MAKAGTKQLEVFTTIVDYIANRGRQLQLVMGPVFSQSDELAKWADLHSPDVISDEQFAVKKAALLA